MATMIYGGLTSLDGYINDQNGDFAWAAPDEEVHAFVNDQDRSTGTYLYGRRMYEIMTVWETDPSLAADSAVTGDYAQIWQAADKIVYSTTLTEVSTTRTRIERTFDPVAVRSLKAEAQANITIFGPTLAASALRAGLVDELQLYLVPVVVGGGTRFLPDDLRLDLELLSEHRFASGMVHLRYAVRH